MQNKRINPNLKNLRRFAELTRNPNLEVDERIFEKAEQIRETAPDLKGFIYVPSIKLYVSKERSLHGKNWYETHEELQKQGLFMPTIKQFIEFVKYLRSEQNNHEYQQILDEILAIRSPRRAEWLDAKFTKENNQLYINYNHRVNSRGELEARNKEPLEDCLMEDCYADVFGSANRQGLPTKKSYQEVYYWYPRKNYVAGFDASSDVAYLGCVWDPRAAGSSLGIFACARSARARI